MERHLLLRRRLVALLLLSIITTLVALGPSRASANGVGMQVVLRYLSGFSNFGSVSATGTAEVYMKEGEIKIAATGLQPLDTETYQFWLMNTRTGEVFNGGRVSPDASGVVSVTNVLPSEVPDRQYDLAFLSVEMSDIVARTPNSRRSIAGTLEATPRPGELPAVLPNTGGSVSVADVRYVPVSYTDSPDQATAWHWGLTGIIAVVAGMCGFMLAKLAQRKLTWR